METTKEEVLENASLAVTMEASYSCYPEDLEEYYKDGMTAGQLAAVFLEELKKKGWFDR